MTVASPPTHLIQEIELLIDEMRPADVPALLGDLERLRARLWLRVNAGNTAPDRRPQRPEKDRLLTAAGAAAILGVKPRWVRDHADEIGGRARLPGMVLRFSERKLRRWMDQTSA